MLGKPHPSWSLLWAAVSMTTAWTRQWQECQPWTGWEAEWLGWAWSRSPGWTGPGCVHPQGRQGFESVPLMVWGVWLRPQEVGGGPTSAWFLVAGLSAQVPTENHAGGRRRVQGGGKDARPRASTDTGDPRAHPGRPLSSHKSDGGLPRGASSPGGKTRSGWLTGPRPPCQALQLC